MDFFESTKVVFGRMEKLEPEHVSKIMGCLLLKDNGELEMIRLAFSPEHVLQALIDKIKLELDLSPKPTTFPAHVSALLLKKSLVLSNLPTTFTPFTPASSLPPLSSAALPPQNGLWIPQMRIAQQLTPRANWLDSAAVENQFGSYNLDDSCYQMQTYYPQPSLGLLDLQMPVCNSFRQGYCKYGGSCGFLHVFQMENGDCMVLNPPTTDEILSSAERSSLKLLEVELIELLKSRRGIPVSVSSLPILYLDQYGKVLQIEGYQKESQRQGRFICRIIQLLARMTSSICLTNRPHGRQSVILVEDINRYAKFKEGNEHELQVYLTFPSESIFSEHEVYSYFNNFGAVREIRIPSQVRRMFGFVTFVHPETAALVLTKTNPHCICGAQVLVKPYQLRRMLFERKTFQHQISNDAEFPDAEFKLLPTARLGENRKLLGKCQSEEHEQRVELETRDCSVSQASDESSLQDGQFELQ
ncbi:hypothetical protein C2S53_011684 [Perilla frutescens var. hirtella]|uniref:Uncharacterized protein n=1 Tax=Perilla frutescens var. hirtella TaxID=608512 RepID=A0AAD4IYZ6_PERFH|nr:hypothetical protein C2S53_011684 [Perilla frutescens var. hirtella]